MTCKRIFYGAIILLYKLGPTGGRLTHASREDPLPLINTTPSFHIPLKLMPSHYSDDPDDCAFASCQIICT